MEYWKYNPRTAGIYITRRCNSKCSYCNVPKSHFISEISVNEWINAIVILEKAGIKRVTILGGEVTLYKGIEKIIAYITTNTTMECSIVTNCNGGEKRLTEMIYAGLDHVCMSVDTIDNSSIDEYSNRKSTAAINKIKWLKQMGVNRIDAYFMLNRQNFKKTLSTAKWLTSRGVGLYIIPYHFGDGSRIWETRETLPQMRVRLAEDDREDLESVVSDLLAYKAKGGLILNSDEYLNDILKYAIDLSWHCSPITSELRIDADGSLMCCNDIRGDLTSQFTVFDIDDRKKFYEFQLCRFADSFDCPGCIWPSQYHSLQDTRFYKP